MPLKLGHTETVSYSYFWKWLLPIQNTVADYLCLARELPYNWQSKIETKLANYTTIWLYMWLKIKSSGWCVKVASWVKPDEEGSLLKSWESFLDFCRHEFSWLGNAYKAKLLYNLPILFQFLIINYWEALSLGTNSQPRYFVLLEQNLLEIWVEQKMVNHLACRRQHIKFNDFIILNEN